MSDNRHKHAMEIAYGMACEQTKPLEKAAEKLHPAPAGELVERLRKQAVCIYIAVERSVAEDIADGLNQAASRITALETEKQYLGKLASDHRDELEAKITALEAEKRELVRAINNIKAEIQTYYSIESRQNAAETCQKIWAYCLSRTQVVRKR